MGKKKTAPPVDKIQEETFEGNVDKNLKYRIDLKCKNKKQKELVKSIDANDIIFVEGVFGVGKTFVINSVALSYLKKSAETGIKKIILICPTLEVGQMHMGLLPGTLEEKLQSHVMNELDSMKKILDRSGNQAPNQILDNLLKQGYIEVRPISYLRGASLADSFICVSEAEEFTKEELFLILSRFENGKMVISGDPLQASRTNVRNGNSGLLHAMERLTNMDRVGIIKFSEEDIVRNDILLDIYKKWKD